MTNLEKIISKKIETFDTLKAELNELLDVWHTQSGFSTYGYNECPICGNRLTVPKAFFTHVVACKEKYGELLKP